MNTYCITLSTIYGKLTIDDVRAESEEQAIERAQEMALEELENYLKIDEIITY